MREQREFRIRVLVFLATYLVAYIIWSVPYRSMPIDYHAMFWFSFPLVVVWAFLSIVIVWKYRLIFLWLAPSALLALYWPVIFAIHGVPSCYHIGNCV
jgi:hypothetical protein